MTPIGDGGGGPEPSFDELPLLPGTDERHAWDVWGREDQLGSVNWIGPAQVRAATRLVESGRVVNLALPLNELDPGLIQSREPYQHTVFRTAQGRDDRLDGFYLQFSSQWDGLRHIRHREHGYWGGRQEADLDDGNELGIEQWARHGIVGRGVLLDARRFLDGMEPTARRPLTPEDLDAVAAAEGVELRRGDIVVLRTGWVEWYLALPPDRRAELRGAIGRQPDPLACPGLDAGRPTAAWLWDHRIAGVATDNPAVEVLPVDRAVGFLHRRLIPLLGLALGEFWALEGLSGACAELGRYEFLLVAGVLNLPGGVGSPASSYAVL